LIVHHMEPDHSANIDKFMEKYKSATVVATAKAFTMMKQFFGTDYAERQIVVGEGDTLSLGESELTFVTAPMVHWPEVMLSYEKSSKTLFSADAFGKFGAMDAEEEWDCEARRYYIGIVGKYGAQVQALLKKAAGLDIARICPLHGPVLSDNLSHYINLYNTWSSYQPETKGVFIAYTSVYGNTKQAALMIASEIENLGEKVSVCDLAREDWAEAVEDAFRYDRIVLATTTYNGGIFPFMHEFINHLTERNFQNKTVGIIENGSWALMAEKTIKSMLEKSKNITYTESGVHIKSALRDENIEEIKALAKELCK
ncbi:MAG: FprA family A-type flavoprotein, partial [Clostridia bacterium]|nr:FprA family A-type flavoprotein [Clostridia bacterium]